MEEDDTDYDLFQVSEDEMTPEVTPETEAYAFKRIIRNKFKAEIDNWIEHVEDLPNELLIEEGKVIFGTATTGDVELCASIRWMERKMDIADLDYSDWQVLQREEIQATDIDDVTTARIGESTVGDSGDNVEYQGFILKHILKTVKTALEVKDVLMEMCGDVETKIDAEEALCEIVGEVVDGVENEVDFMVELEESARDTMEELVKNVCEVGVIVDEMVTSVCNEVPDSPWWTSVPVLRVIDTWMDGDVSRPVNDVQKSALERLREVFASNETKHIPSLKSKARKLVNLETTLVNGLLHNVVTRNITEVNRLLYAGAFVVAERLGMIKERKGNPRKVEKEPRWKRRIEGNIKKWRRDLGLVDAVKKKKLKNIKEKKRLEQVYGLGEKGILYVQEFLKGKIHAGACKVQNYL